MIIWLTARLSEMIKIQLARLFELTILSSDQIIGNFLYYRIIPRCSTVVNRLGNKTDPLFDED